MEVNYISIDEMTHVTFILLYEIEGYVIQGLERDIAAQGDTPEKALADFKDTYAREMALGMKHFLSIPPAPKYYHDLAKKGIGMGTVHKPFSSMSQAKRVKAQIGTKKQSKRSIAAATAAVRERNDGESTVGDVKAKLEYLEGLQDEVIKLERIIRDAYSLLGKGRDVAANTVLREVIKEIDKK